MKALYTIEREYHDVNEKQLKSYNYDSRYQALKDGYKFVHLFKTHINSDENVIHEYYSTMQL